MTLAVVLVGVVLLAGLAGLGIAHSRAGIMAHHTPVTSEAHSYLLAADISPDGGTTQGGGS